jgi:hypothetical protein
MEVKYTENIKKLSNANYKEKTQMNSEFRIFFELHFNNIVDAIYVDLINMEYK